MVIFIDIDNTVVNSKPIMLKFAREIDKDFPDIDNWKYSVFYDRLGYYNSGIVFSKTFSFIYENNIKPYDDAIKFVKTIKDIGASIYFITSRHSKHINITKLWLDNYFPYDKLIMTHDKTSYISEHRCIVFDDDPKVVNFCVSAGIPVYARTDNPWYTEYNSGVTLYDDMLWCLDNIIEVVR